MNQAASPSPDAVTIAAIIVELRIVARNPYAATADELTDLAARAADALGVIPPE